MKHSLRLSPFALFVPLPLYNQSSIISLLNTKTSISKRLVSIVEKIIQAL